jgi:hypothetical protein
VADAVKTIRQSVQQEPPYASACFRAAQAQPATSGLRTSVFAKAKTLDWRRAVARLTRF